MYESLVAKGFYKGIIGDCRRDYYGGYEGGY